MERVHDMLSLTVLLATDPKAVVRVDLIRPAWFHGNCVKTNLGFWMLRAAFMDDDTAYHRVAVWVGRRQSREHCYACGLEI